MLDWGIAWNEYECRKVVEGLVDAVVVELHDMFNNDNPQFPTSAIRLVRTNETVRRALDFNDAPISNPVLPASG